MRILDLVKIANLFFFSKDSLRFLEKNNQTLDFNIKYWLKSGKIISLKNGLYVLKSRWEKEPNKEIFLEYLANKIYEPSYLSLEYIMSKYSLLTEGVYNITSVTTKKTAVFVNKLGTFSYSAVTPNLFTDYEIKKMNGAIILTASKEKSVFDFLYLRFLKNAPINTKAIEELRINWENISLSEFKTIENISKRIESVKVRQVIDSIKIKYYAS